MSVSELLVSLAEGLMLRGKRVEDFQVVLGVELSAALDGEVERERLGPWTEAQSPSSITTPWGSLAIIHDQRPSLWLLVQRK